MIKLERSKPPIATQIVFGENIFINNGNFRIVSSNVCLESKNQAKFINNKKIEFKNNQFFGSGMIINNNDFSVSAYSKLYLGRVKNTGDNNENQLISNSIGVYMISVKIVLNLLMLENS